MGKKAEIDFMDIQPGDVPKTFANIDHTKNKLNYKPKISIKKAYRSLLNGINLTTK